MVDTEFLQAFIEEAESYLPTIRGGILIYLQEGKVFGELELSMNQLHTIKGAAMMIGLEEIGVPAGALEDKIIEIVGKKSELSAEDSARMLDDLAHIEQLLLKARLDDETLAFDFGDFVEESFDNLQNNQQNSGSQKDLRAEDFGEEFSDDITVEDDGDFEIDDEMIEIFALEAEELLRSISVNLEILQKQPDNFEALLEVRRSAHTFKGSAGIVGLKELSKLAHRVEDLLDYLAENEIPGNEKILQLLLDSTDCLAAMTSGEESENLANKIVRIYKDFDQMTALLTHVALPNLDIAQVESFAPLKPEIEETPPATDHQIGKMPSANPKSIVRVSLEKLDDLVRIVRGLVSTRSVFEQRLGELDRQIEELTNSTRRLQRSTNKFETEFESELLNLQTSSTPPRNQPRTAEISTSDAANSSFDALEFDRYTEFHQTTRELVETTSDALSINSALDVLRGNLEMLFDSQRGLIEEMQDKLLRIRMVNFGSLSTRLHRTVRVTCEEEGKQAELMIEGEHLEVDTQILDSLIEPLLHLLRNSVAHGIEQPDTRRLLGKSEKGRINLRVTNEGTHIILTISDDGRGISASALKEKAVLNNLISADYADSMTEEEAFELIYQPGITTAGKLTQTAGRGVGMNVVRTTVERRQGTISISSEPQKGAAFTIRLPMALAVTRAMLVKVGEHDFAFPLNHIRQISEISAATLAKTERDGHLQLGVIKYSILHLSEMLGFASNIDTNAESTPLVLLESTENPCALLVDEIVKPEEILIKPLGFPLQNMAEMLGAAILGDGRVVPVLDLFYLLNKKKTAARKLVLNPKNAAPAKKEITVLIVDDSPSVRHLNSNLIKKAGFTAIIAKDGLEALEMLQTAKSLPDIILTDVEMPRMDGYELLSSLKRQPPLESIPVIMITSRAGEKHRRKAFDLGVSDYLTKPYDDKVLIEKIKLLTAV